jgi:hypothetical protein
MLVALLGTSTLKPGACECYTESAVGSSRRIILIKKGGRLQNQTGSHHQTP